VKKIEPDFGSFRDSAGSIYYFEDNVLRVLDSEGDRRIDFLKKNNLISKSVSEMIVTKYQEIAEQRLNHQKKIVDEVVLENEALLLLGSNTQNTIPNDFEKFFISPPELDEISRWIKDNNENLNTSNQDPDKKPEPKPSSQEKDSGLWTPGQGV